MNVLSLFDGMSCGRIALDKLGIKVDKYFASEIDKYAIKVSEANYPDIIRLGDVKGVKGSDLPKIDLMIAGSPCQGFSFAGKQLAFDDPRSALFFEFTRLLDECKPKYFLLENVRMKKEHLQVITDLLGVEPILINSALVSAQNRNRYYWTNIPGVAQPKDKGIVLKDILETNVYPNHKLSDAKVDRVLNTPRGKGYFYNKDSEKIGTLIAGYYKEPTDGIYIVEEIPNFDKELTHMTTKDGKAYTLTASYNGAVYWNSIEKKQRTMIPTTPLRVGTAIDMKGHDMHKRIYSEEGKSPTLLVDSRSPKIPTTPLREVSVDSYITIDHEKKQLIIKEATKKGYTIIEDGDCFDITHLKSTTRRGRNMKDKSNCLTNNYDYVRFEYPKDLNPASIVGRRINDRGVREDYNKDVPLTQCLQVKHNSDKSGCLTTVDKDNVVSSEEPGRYADVYNDSKLFWRKLTPLECERLQTVPDGYTSAVSNSQRYKMLGNGWTVDVITHIFEGIKDA